MARTLRSRAVAMLVAAGAVLALAPAATATDATLGATVSHWSRTLGTDARVIGQEAKRRHPRRMATYSDRFRRDATRARTAVSAQQPSTANGRKARQLALSAFATYVRAGSRWAASGRARAGAHRTTSQTLARAAAADALTGNRLLLAASKLLR